MVAVPIQQGRQGLYVSGLNAATYYGQKAKTCLKKGKLEVQNTLSFDLGVGVSGIGVKGLGVKGLGVKDLGFRGFGVSLTSRNHRAPGLAVYTLRRI